MEVSWAPTDTLNIEFERLPIVHHQQNALKLSEHGNDDSFCSIRIELDYLLHSSRSSNDTR